MAYVYVMTNISMPGLVKVGHTYCLPMRVQQLSAATGIPTEFEVAFHLETDDPQRIESLAHEALADRRVNTRREFFYTKPATAKRAIEVAALMAAWNKAAPEARREFLGRIETPIFEKGAA